MSQDESATAVDTQRSETDETQLETPRLCWKCGEPGACRRFRSTQTGSVIWMHRTQWGQCLPN